MFILIFILSSVSFRRCKVMAILAYKQEFCRLLPEVIATAAAIRDKWAARLENVSQISPALLYF